MFIQLFHQISDLCCDDITQNVKKSSFLKKVCDGEVIVTKLHQAGDVKIDINGKLFITTNHMLTFDTNDFGIQRRLKYYDYKNVFEDRDENVNEEIGHYKKVIKDYYKLHSTQEKLKFFNIIAPYASLFYQNCPIPKPFLLKIVQLYQRGKCLLINFYIRIFMERLKNINFLNWQ